MFRKKLWCSAWGFIMAASLCLSPMQAMAEPAAGTVQENIGTDTGTAGTETAAGISEGNGSEGSGTDSTETAGSENSSENHAETAGSKSGSGSSSGTAGGGTSENNTKEQGNAPAETPEAGGDSGTEQSGKDKADAPGKTGEDDSHETEQPADDDSSKPERPDETDNSTPTEKDPEKTDSSGTEQAGKEDPKDEDSSETDTPEDKSDPNKDESKSEKDSCSGTDKKDDKDSKDSKDSKTGEENKTENAGKKDTGRKEQEKAGEKKEQAAAESSPQDAAEPVRNAEDTARSTTSYSTSVQAYQSSRAAGGTMVDRILSATKTKRFIRTKAERMITKCDTRILESMLTAGQRVVAKAGKGATVRILKKIGTEWAYAETRDADGKIARGYIAMKDCRPREQEKEDRKLVQVLVGREENKAFYVTGTTTFGDLIRETGTSASRDQLVSYSMQFLGNPYVWGGESLTNGCDCSGFTMLIYRNFGIELPRCSYEQAEVGQKISVKDALPGDLIFYQRDGQVYHVLIAIGDGKAINASSSTTGIIISDIDEEKACWGVRLLDGRDSTQADSLAETAEKAESGDETARRDIIEALAKPAKSEGEAYGLLPSMIIAQAVRETGWASFRDAREGGIRPEDNNLLSLSADLGGEEWKGPWTGNESVRNVSRDSGTAFLGAETKKEEAGTAEDTEDTSAEKENPNEKATVKSGENAEEKADTAEDKHEDRNGEKAGIPAGAEAVDKAEHAEEKESEEQEEDGYEEKAVRTYEDIEACFADYAAYQTDVHPEVADETDVDTVIEESLEGEEYKEEIRGIIEQYDLTQYDTEDPSGEYPADPTNYTQSELELIWAIVAQEDDTSYEGALAVISSAMNRADANYGGYGTTALEQLTADGQYCYSPKVSDPSLYERRLGGNVPEFVMEAVSDCLEKGIRNTEFLNFRSSNRTGSYVQIGSNFFF